MSARPVLDVSGLPQHEFDTAAPLWWGNLWMLVIETTIFGIAFATYFYLRQNFQLWPPPRTEPPPLMDPLPVLAPGTINAALILLSCLPMWWVDRSARRGDKGTLQIGMVVCVICGLVAIVLRLFEFPAMRFSWDSNAYGSIVWAILILHTLHLVAATLETAVLALWVFVRQADMHHRVDITVTAVYWYWVAGVWVILYFVVYWVPRVR